MRKKGHHEDAATVVEDGNWVTSRQPDDLPAFTQAMGALFPRARWGTTVNGTAETP